MQIHRSVVAAVCCLVLLWILPFCVPTEDSADRSQVPDTARNRRPPAETETGKEPLDIKIHALELIDQDGNRVNFQKDVIGDRVAVIIPFYTNCTSSFPILVYMLARLQELLGPHLGKDVVLVSVSVDPKTDNPLRLKSYARRHKARPGWVFLTGERNNLGQALWGVGVLSSSNIDEHNHIPVTMVGGVNSEWKRFHGFPSPEQIMAQVEGSLVQSRGSQGG